uniref:PDZ domain-containing protein n=1 Tax=Parastrongyloides trichosuri TaxID=131310 RepID=A0A0N4ZSD4_PARTI
MENYDVYTFEIPWKENEVLGITPNENLIVMNIQEDTLAYGLFKIGDKICKVNGLTVSTINELEIMMQSREDVLYITIERCEEKEKTLTKQISFTGEKSFNISKREGFEYFTEKLKMNSHKKFKFSLKGFQNRVIVSKIKGHDKNYRNIRIGDQIHSVNDNRVTDKDVCRSLINYYLLKQNVVTLTIGRPITAEASEEINELLDKKILGSKSLKMANDVQEIVKRECENILNNTDQTRKGILSGPTDNHRNVSFDTCIKEFFIASDTEGKRLKKVRKRY